MGTTFTATSKAADAPEIEPAVYDGKFQGVAVKFIKGGQYGDGDRFEWSFVILDDDGEALYWNGDQIELTGLTSMSTNVLSKTQPRAVRYLKALMTAAEFASFTEGNGIKEDDLVGRVAQVEVYVKDNGWPAIANVLPPRRKTTKKPAGRPAAAATADVDED